MDKLAFLDGPEGPSEDLQLDEPATPEPMAAPEPAPADPESANPLAPPVVEAKPDPGFVPLTVVLDERDKRKKLEAELAQFRASQQQQTPAQVPDVFEDPNGYTQHIEQKFEERLYRQQADMSYRFAVQASGKETVETAVEWARAKCDADPYFNAQVRESGDPVGYAVNAHQREMIASQVSGDDFAQFQAWKAAQGQLSQQPAAAPAAVTETPAPPRSIASAPSAGGTQHIATGSGVAFDETFRN